MKKNLLLPSIFLSFCLTAQENAAVKKSVVFKLPEKLIYFPPAVLSDGTALHYGFDKNIASFDVRIFDKELGLQTEKTIKRKVLFDEEPRYITQMQLGNKNYAFFRQVFPDEKKEGLCAIDLSVKTEIKEKAKVAFKSSGKIRSYGELGPASVMSKFDYGYNYMVSEDQKSALFAFSNRPTEKNDQLSKEVIGIRVVDENLNTVRTEEIEMHYPENKTDNIDYMLADDGTVFIVSLVYTGEGKTKENKNPPAYRELIVCDKAGGATFVPLVLPEETYIPFSVHVYENPSHEIFVMGYYQKPNMKSIGGLYIMKWNPKSGKLQKVGEGTYDVSFPVSSPEIRKVHTGVDGTMRVVSEEHYTTMRSVSNMDPNHSTSSYTLVEHYYEDVILMTFDVSGKLLWTRQVSKQQRSEGPGNWTSINVGVDAGTVDLFYVDKGTDESILKQVIISPAGEISQKDVCKIAKDHFFPIRDFVRNNGTLTGIEINSDNHKANLISVPIK